MRPSSGLPRRARANYSIRNDSELEVSARPCIEVMRGAVLSRLHVLSDEEWTQLKADECPLEAVYVEGIGWVAAMPCQIMN
jgi:hypothetical protein